LTPSSSPTLATVWLCTWSDRPALYVRAADAAGARRELERLELPAPACVTHAGYSATPPAHAPAEPAKPRRLVERVRPRARAALRLLAALRADWPIPSMLERPRYSDAALYDFVGNMSLALGRLAPPRRRQVERLVDLEARAAFHRSWKLNAQRAGDREAELDHDRRAADAAASARRLAKRQAVRRGLAELDAAIAGELEALEAVALWYEAWLSSEGYTEEEALRFTAAWRRILVPRL
jgi:hypothetical protein